MSKEDFVLVTGVTGFLGSHVVHQLLEAGYSVRGVARSPKVAVAQQGYAPYGDQYEVVGIDDLVNGDFSAALKGVKAVIHVAAPLAGRTATAAEALDVAISGSLNLFRQAALAGVTNFAYVSSIATLGKYTEMPEITDKLWFQITRTQAEKLTDGFSIYIASKTLAELAVWEFAEQHPHIEMTTVNPPFLYGPFAPGFSNPEGSRAALSTNHMIYDLLRPDGPIPLRPSYIDVRDVARGLVNALRSPPTSQVGRKRILMSGEWFSAQQAVEYIASVRPELKDRLSEAAKRPAFIPKSRIDNKRAAEVLGLTDITPWKVSVIDTVDDLLKMEENLKKRGIPLPI